MDANAIYLNGFDKESIDFTVKYGVKRFNEINVDLHKFSGGECHVKIKNIDSIYDNPIFIFANIHSSDDLMNVLLVKDALDNINIHKKLPIYLFIPYIPYARQDRIMVKGEPFSAKVFAKLLNQFNFDLIFVFDAHSDISPTLINNCINLSNEKFVNMCIMYLNNKYKLYPTLISPDSGAYKKIFKLSEYLKKELDYNFDIVLCNKARDLNNGNILSYSVDKNDLGGKDCVIVDDICDGGGTFILIAQELRKRNCGRLFLIVSHGIFSKGIEKLEELFDGIFTTTSFNRPKNSTKTFAFDFKEFIDFKI